MSFLLHPVDTLDAISPADFKKNYLDQGKPLVIKNLSKDWPAREKWTTDYLKSIAGDLVVPLYDNAKADPSKPINTAAAEMKFGDYLDLIKNEPTELRIFFFNIFKHYPALLNDIKIPKELMGGFIESMPAMFFGGSNSITFLHYDIDLPHLFHTHFGGRKQVILFENKWKRRLYCLPNATYALEDYDVLNPDYERFPALQGEKERRGVGARVRRKVGEAKPNGAGGKRRNRQHEGQTLNETLLGERREHHISAARPAARRNGVKHEQINRMCHMRATHPPCRK